MTAYLEFDEKLLDRAEKLLYGIPGASEKAVSRAFNRALQAGRTAGVREASKIYTAKSSTVRADFDELKKAKAGELYAELAGHGSNLPLTKYLYRPKTDTTGSRRAPVYAAVRKGGVKSLGGRAFVRGGQVFVREGRSRLPIRKLYGPSVPSLLNNEQVVDAVMETMKDTTERRLDHEILRILEGQG